MEEHIIDAKEYSEDIKSYLTYNLSKECVEICHIRDCQVIFTT